MSNINQWRLFKYLREHPVVGQLFRFLIVGLTGAAFDFAVFSGLTTIPFWRTHYLAANSSSFVFSNLLCFFGQRNWTFKNKRDGVFKQYLQYLFVTLIAFFLGSIVLYIGIDIYNWHYQLAKFFSLAVAAVCSFIINRCWTFKNHENAN
jgi:putative flippase GtrA